MRNGNLQPAHVPSPEARAALFGAHYHAANMGVARPSAVSRAFARLAPHRLPHVMDNVARADAGKRASDAHVLRCAGVEIEPLRKKQGLAPRATSVAAGTRSRAALAKAASPEVKSETQIDFDEFTWVTTVTVHSVFPGRTEAEANAVFTSADPRFWAKYQPNTVFESTLVGDWDAGASRFVQSRAPMSRKWEHDGGGLIQEKVVWNWNEEAEGYAINVIEFFHVARADRRYDYKYRLYHSEEASFVGAPAPGGIDIDEGSFEAVWTPASLGNGRRGSGFLEITAVKTLHYVQQENAPAGIDQFLNLMAPALASLFMRQLALHGVTGLLAGTIKPKK